MPITQQDRVHGNTIATGWTFAQVPVWLLTNHEISDGAKVLFAYLKYRQGTDAACWPSYALIAKHLGISERVAMRRVKELEEAGYIRRHHRTGKTNLYELIAAPSGEAERWQNQQNRPQQGGDGGVIGGVTKMSGGGDENVTHDDTHGHDTKKHTSGSPEASQPKIPGFPDDTPAEEDKPDGRAWFVALADCCSIDIKVATGSMRGRIGQSSKKLKEANASPDEIARFRSWWDYNDWRGKQGNAPLPHQVRDEWGRFKNYLESTSYEVAIVEINGDLVDDPLRRTPREYEICRMPGIDMDVYNRLEREGRTEVYE